MSRFESDPEQADAEIQHARDDVERLVRLHSKLRPFDDGGISQTAAQTHRLAEDDERDWLDAGELRALDDELRVAEDHLARTVRYWLW